jgi:hypothetical protein
MATSKLIIDQSPETSTPNNQAFYLAEYECLRAEILQTLTDSRNLERNIVFAVGVSLAWILSHRNMHWLVWSIPLGLVLVGILRSGALLISFGLYAEYMRRLESHLTESAGPGGWERFRKDKSLGISNSAFIFWGLMLAGSIFIAIARPTVTSESSIAPQTPSLSRNAPAPALTHGAAGAPQVVREAGGVHHN